MPGALALGIPTAILAHTVLFQGSHQVGGPLHDALLLTGAAVSVGFVVFFAAFALTSPTATTTGSLLSTRLAPWLPSAWLLGLSALGWYTAIECSETDGHAPAPMFALAVALVVCALAVRWAAQLVVRTIASVTLGARLRPFAERARGFAPRRPALVPSNTGRIAANRRFARPPPSAMQRA